MIDLRIIAGYATYSIAFDISLVSIAVPKDNCRLTSPACSNGVTHLSAVDVRTSAGTSVLPKLQRTALALPTGRFEPYTKQLDPPAAGPDEGLTLCNVG